ncbi:RINT-1 / TIP-1 family protein [Corchorus olitorius]|uniref:RINT-1 / TIP-1 family protein n=1 Tax=Corchorus olitorius TaxID=93759 RepID=A0A1R3JFW4_9ROSI|nr:RINT-1 / TIP-1 family protein [Corchorus olitorius]
MEGCRHRHRHHENLILPKVGKLHRPHSEYLDQQFKTQRDLSSSSSSCLLSEWTNHCSELDAFLLHLRTNLNQSALSWISRSFRAKSCLLNLNLALYSSSPDATASQSHTMQRILGEQLPRLTLHLRRIHDIRQYLETALCLEALVGDLEDAVFSSGNAPTVNMFKKLSTSMTLQDFGLKQERLFQAIKAMNDIEEIIINVEKSQQWHHLSQSVDHRVDRTLSVVRPEALAEHRVLLASLGWPPNLLTSKVEDGGISELPNPLVLMHGDEKKFYAQSFQVLCSLQKLQRRREVRKFVTLSQKECDKQLWPIDELVSPIAERMEYHFLKWAEQPEFIFALVYKMTRDYMVGVSDILQPLIDAARLSSYSANEAWVSAMVNMLSGFLTKMIFPALAERYKEKDMKLEVMSLWLHLVDLMVGFDKRMRSLLRSETCLFLPDAERYPVISSGISVLIIFCDRPDLLKIWAKIELKDGLKKLKAELKDARAWLIDDKHRVDINGSIVSEIFLLASREDYKAPLISESAVRIAQGMIDRSRTLPAILARVKFVRLTVARFFWYFSKLLLMHCKNAELSPESSDDGALVRVCQSINAATYVESKLQEWSDDVSFSEMKIAEEDSNIQKEEKGVGDGCFFEEEIEGFAELETNLLMEVIGVLLRQFENLTLGFNHNIDVDENLTPNIDSAAIKLTVSSGFIEALDTLRNQLHFLKLNLNAKDFSDLWRSVADGLDHFISGNVFAGDVQFSRKQTYQFSTDMHALFLVFQPFCARPEAFFPCIRDILRLLTISKEEVNQLLVALTSTKCDKYVQCYGSYHLSIDQLDKISRSRKF